MKVHVFAALKDVMPAEVDIAAETLHDIASLKEALKLIYPKVALMLEACRFSTEKELISLDQVITAYEHIYIIPPSSGG